MGTALDDLIALLELEPLEVNLFRGVSPERGPPAGVRRAGRGPGARRGGPHRRARPAGALAARVLPAARRPDASRSSTRSTASATARASRPAGSSRSSTGAPIFNLQASFHVVEAGPDHQYPMPDVPTPEELPTFQERLEPSTATGSRRRCADWLERERPIDQRPAELPRWIDPGPREPQPGRLDQGERDAARRPAAPRRASSSYASDLTMLDTAMLPHGNSYRRGRVPDREPRPRDVVPPPVPRRRLAALPPEEPVGVRRARHRRRARSSRSDGQLAITVIQEGLMRPIRHRAERGAADAIARRTRRPALRHGHDADAGDAHRDGRGRGRRRRVRRGPDGQPARRSSPPTLLGKEAALYTPSGTMANQLAIRVLAPTGHRGARARRARTCTGTRRAAAASNSGVQIRPLAGRRRGRARRRDRAAALEAARHHLPPVSLVTIENTHMPANGRPCAGARGRATVACGRRRARAAAALRRRAHL